MIGTSYVCPFCGENFKEHFVKELFESNDDFDAVEEFECYQCYGKLFVARELRVSYFVTGDK